MDLEKLIKLVFEHPVSIQYSNINGKEKLLVNGENFLTKDETFDDTDIKNQIADYKETIEDLDDDIFELVMNEAENRHFNLKEMNQGLELETYTEEDALYAENVINIMINLIVEVIENKIKRLQKTLSDISC